VELYNTFESCISTVLYLIIIVILLSFLKWFLTEIFGCFKKPKRLEKERKKKRTKQKKTHKTKTFLQNEHIFTLRTKTKLF